MKKEGKSNTCSCDLYSKLKCFGVWAYIDVTQDHKVEKIDLLDILLKLPALSEELFTSSSVGTSTSTGSEQRGVQKDTVTNGLLSLGDHLEKYHTKHMDIKSLSAHDTSTAIGLVICDYLRYYQLQ